MKNNIFDNLPNHLPNEVFDELVSHESVTIERILSHGQRSPETGWYDQDRNEWVMVVQGEAILAFESGDRFHLTPGCYVTIPAHQNHRVEWTDPHQITVWLAVHY